MTIPQLPANTVSDIADKLRSAKVTQNLSRNLTDNFTWTRGLATGSLIAGAILLVTGNRRAGIAFTAVGAAAALLEDVDGTRELWDSIPTYIESGQQVLNRVEKFVEEVAEQGQRVAAMLNKQIR
jgi:hypothetical protein